MKDICVEKKNNINDENIKLIEESHQEEEKKFLYKIDLNSIRDEEDDLYYNAKRSYSCKVGDSKKIKFTYDREEIKLNLSKQLIYLKTPQIRPKKSTLIPNPIYLGSTICSSKKTRYNSLSDKNVILSEDGEESIDNSSDSLSLNIEEKENIQSLNNIIEKSIEKNIINIKKKLPIQKFSIEEENDDYNEKGELIFIKLRKNMFKSKKIFSKKYKNNNELEHFLTKKYDIIKESILNYYEEEVPQNLFKTVGFSQVKNNDLPILGFLQRRYTQNYK